MKKNKKIFLIEDDPAIIDVYKTAFKTAGLNFEIINWGKQAIERIKEIRNKKIEKPALVLLDLILPDIDGSEILKEIKCDESTKDIMVFVLSNYNRSQLPETDGCDPDKFIVKAEITPTKLIELIKENLKK